MTIRSGLRSGIRSGLQAGLNPGAVTVATDGPSSWYTPATAADWVALGLPAPAHQWPCNDASGNLVRSIGTIDLVKSGATGISYANAVTGWTRTFAGLDGAAANRGWFTSDASFTPAINESYAWFAYVGLKSVGATTEYFLDAGGTPWSVRLASSGVVAKIEVLFNAVSTTGVSDWGLNSLSTIRPVLFGRNCTTSAARCFTDQEQLTGTYSGAAVASGTKGVFTHSANGINARFGLIAHWSGADAETVLAKTSLQALGVVLPY